MNTWRILCGDVREKLAELPAGSCRTCVTSPPYWGLRDYGTATWDGGDPACDHKRKPGGTGGDPKYGPNKGQAGGAPTPMGQTCIYCGARRIDAQLGLEPTPDAYVEHMVAVFREVRRVLADDGTLWLNLGDSYQNAKGQAGGVDPKQPARRFGLRPQGVSVDGLKPKDLVGIPWMVAFALRADGWYLRSDIIWSKPNPMPESVTDRPTKAHEYIFLLSKARSYYYDAAAIREPYAPSTVTQFDKPYDGQATKDYAAVGVQNPSAIKKRITDKQRGHGRRHAGFNDRWDDMERTEQLQNGANKRSVWNVATSPYPDAHFATFPEKLIKPCILAGSAPGDTVLDPFTGSGTTGAVAIRYQRNFLGCELNPAYVELARKRIHAVAPMFAQEVA